MNIFFYNAPIFSCFGVITKLNVTTAIALSLLLAFFPKFGFLLLSSFVFLIPHEYAHALAAKRFGYEVEDIAVLPFGCATRLSSELKIGRHEYAVAAAGPIASLAVGVILFACYCFTDGIIALAFITSSLINLAICIFNIVPILPLDGGRMLRSALSVWLGGSATRYAVYVGRASASTLVAIGILFGADIFFYVVIVSAGIINELFLE